MDFSAFGTDAIMKKVSDKAHERRLGVAREKVESLRCRDHGKAVTVSMEETGKLVLTAAVTRSANRRWRRSVSGENSAGPGVGAGHC